MTDFSHEILIIPYHAMFAVWRRVVKVTFKVENGAWNDDTTDDIEITIPYNSTLTSDQIPEAGQKPDEGFLKGDWEDPAPDTETVPAHNRRKQVFESSWDAILSVTALWHK
jgi:hypothetical protein